MHAYFFLCSICLFFEKYRVEITSSIGVRFLFPFLDHDKIADSVDVGAQTVYFLCIYTGPPIKVAAVSRLCAMWCPTCI